MKKWKRLKMILEKTSADRLLLGYGAFFLVVALLLWRLEPGIGTYREGLWYCYTIFSTVGFGDIVAVTTVGRILSILLSLYSIVLIALVTGVIVAFYNDLIATRYKASKAELLDKLEHLEDLSREELADLSERIRSIM